jgi:hypothetical protein
VSSGRGLVVLAARMASARHPAAAWADARTARRRGAEQSKEEARGKGAAHRQARQLRLGQQALGDLPRRGSAHVGDDGIEALGGEVRLQPLQQLVHSLQQALRQAAAAAIVAAAEAGRPVECWGGGKRCRRGHGRGVCEWNKCPRGWRDGTPEQGWTALKRSRHRQQGQPCRT